MRQIALLFSLLTVSSSVGCQQLAAPPSDLNVNNLDPVSAVDEADSIVLAYPVERRDLNRLTFRAPGTGEPLSMVETETTLDILQVIKGPALTPAIRFLHYRPIDEKILMGPPRGPSGPMFSRGVFFLNRRPNGVFRSVVDFYRPFIPTPWIVGSVDEQPCVQPRECLARLLLVYHTPDEAEVFCNHLHESVAVSRQPTGFLTTFGLLNGQVSSFHPEAVRRAACSELAKWFALELPAACASVLSESRAAEEYARAATRLREQLNKDGVPWIERRIGADTKNSVARYLDILMKSSDPETRNLASNLLKSLR